MSVAKPSHRTDGREVRRASERCRLVREYERPPGTGDFVIYVSNVVPTLHHGAA
jgi:hypothetical protein